MPDLLPVELSQEFLDSVRDQLPELPEAKARALSKPLALPPTMPLFTSDRALAEYFETAASASNNGKLTANWVLAL